MKATNVSKPATLHHSIIMFPNVTKHAKRNLLKNSTRVVFSSLLNFVSLTKFLLSHDTPICIL
ncbi:hypothetical protein PUN28_019516 [Cardiocondyla obscurior]|uniref:Uncharacterized protein n=1 Tax=Cardiocondyla obscurior TaxID=286306 RepID=A0AAW2ECT0_9HYME